MLQSQELRIGNWVNNTTGEMQVSGITDDEIYFKDGDCVPAKFIHPIPLTPDILEKLGEVKFVMGDTSKYYKIGELLFGEDDFELSKGLHWLQNYYFFRTGTELNYNP